MITSTPPEQERKARTVRVLIVDDHPIVRMGISQMLSNDPDYDVCGEAPGMSQAMKLFHDEQPDIVIVDLSLKNGSGLELVKEMVAMRPSVKILVQSLHDESLFAERALRAGAKGYINKDQATEKLLVALRRIRSGKVYLSEPMTERLLCRSVGQESADADDSPVERLSDRELEVFEWIGHGLTTRQIAEKLHLSPKTIETYREHIKEKLNLRNSTELTQHAVQWVLENS